MRSSLVCLVLLLVQPVAAQGATPSWSAQKCALYEAAWHQALETFGSDQMNYAFMAGNENFIASGCDERGEICPQSRQEFEVSNAIALALINGGTASTFLPFNCPRPEPGEGAWSGPALESRHRAVTDDHFSCAFRTCCSLYEQSAQCAKS